MKSMLLTVMMMVVFAGAAMQAPSVIGRNIARRQLNTIALENGGQLPDRPELEGIRTLSASKNPDKDMKYMLGDYRKSMAALSPEEREYYKEICPQAEMLDHPAVKNLLGAAGMESRSSRFESVGGKLSDVRADAGSGKKDESASRVEPSAAETSVLTHWKTKITLWFIMMRLRYYDSYKGIVFGVLWGIPLLMLLGGALLYGLKQYEYAGLVGFLLFGGAKKLLFWLSVFALSVFIFSGVNVMLYLPDTLWYVPVLFLIGSGIFLRGLDMNYPLWNSTLKALAMPIAASAVTLGWDYIAAFSGLV